MELLKSNLLDFIKAAVEDSGLWFMSLQICSISSVQKARKLVNLKEKQKMGVFSSFF